MLLNSGYTLGSFVAKLSRKKFFILKRKHFYFVQNIYYLQKKKYFLAKQKFQAEEKKNITKFYTENVCVTNKNIYLSKLWNHSAKKNF